jgi:hypothetical protein
MAVKLTALRTRRNLLTRKIIIFMFLVPFLLETEWTPGPSAAGRIRYIEIIHSPHRVSNLPPSVLQHSAWTTTLPRDPKGKYVSVFN